jgi:hypothetical protein
MTIDSAPSHALITIPVVDLRSGGPVAYAAASLTALDELRAGCVAFVPALARPLLPLAEALCRRWLDRSASLYAGEVHAIAALLDKPGIYLGNTAYEWACTVGSYNEEPRGPVLLRTLDWAFAGLGRYVIVARQEGTAGDFWNVTWPGAVGVVTANAPGRFTASINQAPLRRRTRSKYLRFIDYGLNAVRTFWRVAHAPPEHVLRYVFETAVDYVAAKEMLCSIPVARPVIFVLAGVKCNQVCVIEREETTARVIDGAKIVGNDWQEPRAAWEARSCGGAVDADSQIRCATLARHIQSIRRPFSWLVTPIHNWATRVAVEMSANGLLRVIGFEPSERKVPARQCTSMIELNF